MRRLAALALLGVVAAGCSGGDSPSSTPSVPSRGETAGEAITRQFMLLSQGQVGRLWEEMHPAHQQLISRSTYMLCTRDMPIELTGVEVIDTYPERYTIPGTNVETDSTAVTFTVEQPGGGSWTDTSHEVKVRGRWRFTVADPDGCLSTARRNE